MTRESQAPNTRLPPWGYIWGDCVEVDTAIEIDVANGKTLRAVSLDNSYIVAAAEEKEFHSFEIDSAQVENVKQRCLLNALNFPLLEEYDFHNDMVSTTRSDIIVIPCGAGKSLVGWSVACRIKKSSLHLATNDVKGAGLLYRKVCGCSEIHTLVQLDLQD
ncbi:DNA repair helicase XPB1 [Artemisia annua]|uniref:DNA repair helicase XPB1 n=1 Tax=Artemisia annua TaxID=35608 RepID=A0A2U1KLR3_ARTAN|nr:DNA repair helicase XPB1 [Artemisia annua]